MIVTRLLLPAVLLIAACGCAGPVKAWQKSLETYVAREGNGDLNVLRTLDTSPAESDFSPQGVSNAGMPFLYPLRTDAGGVLLGYRTALDRPWYIFLVGFTEYKGTFQNFPVDEHTLTDIRMIACSARDGMFTWLAGEPDPEALALYCTPQLQAWRASHADRAAATEAPTTFPTPADILRLETTPDSFIVTDDHSGARWVLTFP